MSNERPSAEVDSEKNFARLDEVIRDIKFAMMTTLDASGALQSRPMTTQKQPDGQAFDGTLWFFTGQRTSVADEIAHDPRVNLTYANADDSQFVSVAGTAAISHDRELMRSMWSDIYKAWFPKGLDDPDLCLLQVKAERAEYWEPPSGKNGAAAGTGESGGDGRTRENRGGHHVIEMEGAPGNPAAAKSKTTTSW